MPAPKNPPIKIELNLTADDNFVQIAKMLFESMAAGKMTQNEGAMRVASAILDAVPQAIAEAVPTPPPAPVVAPVPVHPAFPVLPVQEAAPVAEALPVMPPVVPVATPAMPPVVPVAAAAVSLEALCREGATLVQHGVNVQGILPEFGVISMSQLKQEQYDPFAVRLRQLAAEAGVACSV